MVRCSGCCSCSGVGVVVCRRQKIVVLEQPLKRWRHRGVIETGASVEVVRGRTDIKAQQAFLRGNPSNQL